MMKSRDVAAICEGPLALPLASPQEILMVLQIVVTTWGNISKSRPGGMTEKLGAYLLEWHTNAELEELAGVKGVYTTTGGLCGAGKLATKGPKGQDRQYKWTAQARKDWLAAHPAAEE
jgi:hypothetical protein